MAYTGPGDLQAYRVWAGLRGYRASYATPGNNPCCDIWLSGSFVGTVNILPNGAMDTATAAALTGGRTGQIGKLYDQTGGGNHFINTNPNTQPSLRLSAPGLGAGQPAVDMTNTGSMFTTNNISTTTQPWTMTCFAMVTFAEPFADIVLTLDSVGNDLFLGFNTANTAQFQGFNAVTKAETDNVWHSMAGVANGTTNGIIAVDGSSSTGQNTGTAVPDGAHKLFICSFQNFVGYVTEVGYSDLAGFSTSDITALNSNDQFWFTSLVPGGSRPGGFEVGPAIRRSSRVISY